MIEVNIVILLITWKTSDVFANTPCVGLNCYNEGTISNEENICKCLCPDGYTGLLCEIKMEPSKWPDGPYWLLMPKDGCPEVSTHGWEMGYIKFTANVSEADALYYSYMASLETNVSGIFGPYTYKMNFCYKSVRHVNNVTWPSWDFAVFGQKNSCPTGMTESTLNLTMTPILNVMTDGSIPDVYFTEAGQFTDIVFVLCAHEKSVNEHVHVPMAGKGPFLFTKHPTSGCTVSDDVAYNETYFPLPTVIGSLDHLFLCYYIPNTSDEMPLDIFEINADCNGVLQRTVKVEIEECKDYIYRFWGSEDCTKSSWLYIDLLQTITVSGIVFKLKMFLFNSGYHEIEKYFLDATLDIFVDTVAWDDRNTFAQRCLHSHLFHNDSKNNDHLAIFKCARNYEGRYVTVRINNNTAIATTASYTKYGTNTIEVYGLSCRRHTGSKPTIPCNTDLGMKSYAIQDFQLTASSSYDKYAPYNARPGLSGWQAAIYDDFPFIQIDLLAVTVVNGIVIYNWYERASITKDNVYFTALQPKGCASFTLKYGTSLQNLIYYSDKEYVIDMSQTQEQPQQFVFYKHFLARYVRVYPKPLWYDRAGLKFELLGCRNFGIPSPLSCNDPHASNVFKVSKMFVPYSASYVSISNTSLTCEDECMSDDYRCTGVLVSHTEYGELFCTLVLQGYSSRYEELKQQHIANVEGQLLYTAMKICWNNAFQTEYTAVDILSTTTTDYPVMRLLRIPSSVTAYVTGEQMISSFGYPFYYHTDFVGIWIIQLKEGFEFIALQFTDIHLKEKSDDYPDAQTGNEYCEEKIYFLRRKNAVAQSMLSRGGNYMHWYQIDNTFNGRKAHIGTRYSRLEMVFRSCPAEYYKQKNAGGFRVKVQVIDVKACTIFRWPNSCFNNLMEITSNTFNEIPSTQTVTWKITMGPGINTYRFILITLKELLVSCFSGSILTIDKQYCNLRSSILPIELRDKNMEITFTVRPYCSWYPEVEGFRLKYEVGKTQASISSAVISIPDLPDNSLENTSREVCSSDYQKCYNIFRSDTTNYNWTAAFALCKEFGMRLVSLGSKQEMQFVKGFVAIQNENEIIYCYIGLFRYIDAEQVSYEQWVDGRPLSFTAWEYNQPEPSKTCTVMAYTDLNNLASWKSIYCDEKLANFVVCERSFNNESHTGKYHHDFKFTLTEPEPDTTGYVSVASDCICNAEDLSVTWFYKSGNEIHPFREKSQLGYFLSYKQCNRSCGKINASILYTGFYYTNPLNGIPISLQVNITHRFYPKDVKTLVTANIYRITDSMDAVDGVYNLWNCSNGDYISILARCNGYFECSNLNDELGCESVCDEDQFKCTDGRCIHVSQLCDFIPDCLDSSDEYCDNTLCAAETSFQCADGPCIPLYKRCDGYTDCLDETDEYFCDSCNSTTAFQCDDKTCILGNLACDKHIDCPDGSDEESCSKIEFKSCDDVWAYGHTESGLYIIDQMEVKCEFGKQHTTMTFLHPDWECYSTNYILRAIRVQPHDAIQHAFEKQYTCSLKIARVKPRSERMADEADGSSNTSTYISNFGQLELHNTNTTDIYKASDKNEFYYDDDCIQTYENDLNLNNYTYHIEEIICMKDSIRHSPPVPCDEVSKIANLEEKCIYNTNDQGKVGACRSMEHLQDCESYMCSSGFFKCHRSYCIPKKFVCDGIKHCQNNEDESECRWCDAAKGTMLLAGMENKNIPGKRDFYSIFRFASQLNSRMVLFEKSTNENPENKHVFDAHVYSDVFTKTTTRCVFETEEERSVCIKNISEKVNGSYGFQALIWVQRKSMFSSDETPFSELSSSFNHAWKIVIDPSEQYPFRTIHGNIPEIRVRNMKMLRTLGSVVFPEYCNGSKPQMCKNGYRCSLSRVCLPLSQLCDEKYDCPHRDDEQFCDFVCPFNCTCKGFSVRCRESPYYVLAHVSYTTRKVDISNSVYVYKFLKVEKALPYLTVLNASNCQIDVLRSGTFENSRNIFHLDISNNRISKIQTKAFVHLKHLKTLILNGNSYLTTLEPNSFSGVKISILKITNTRLKVLQARTFSGLNLKTLSLSNNMIEKVDGFAFDNLSVEHIQMIKNPIIKFNSDLFSGVKNVKSLETPAFKFCCVKPENLPEENCLPRKDEFSSCDDLMRNTTLQALLWTISLLSLFGNILSVLYRFVYDRKRLKLGYGIFVTNLALADFLMGIYLLIIAVADKVFRDRYIEMDEHWRNSAWCKMAGVLSTVSSEMSVMLICCITIDRIMVIKFPFGTLRFTPFSATIMAIFCWVFASFIALLPLSGIEYFGTMFYGRSAVCLALPLTRERTPGWQYSVVVFVGLNFMLFLLIAIGQLLIYTEVKKQTALKRKMNVARSNDLTVARNLLLLVLTDFLCWFPIGCMGIMALRGNFVPADVYAWTAILILPINSALNPFLYTFSTVLGKKNLKPAVEEQTRSDLSKDIAETVMDIMPYFIMRICKNQSHVINLSDHLKDGRMSNREKVFVVCQLVCAIERLHSNELVLQRITADKIVLRLNSSDNRVARIQLERPRICKSKAERAENMYQLGSLVGQIFFQSCI